MSVPTITAHQLSGTYANGPVCGWEVHKSHGVWRELVRPYMRSPKRFHIQRSQTLRIGCFEAPHFRSDPVVSLFPCISNVGRRFEARWSATLHDCCSERVAYLSTTVHHLVADTNSAIAPADSLKRVTLYALSAYMRLEDI